MRFVWKILLGFACGLVGGLIARGIMSIWHDGLWNPW